MKTSVSNLIGLAAKAAEEFGEDYLEEYAKKLPRCSHNNILEECPQCDSDFQLEVDSSVLDRVPDDFTENDDPDMGLDDIFNKYWPFGKE